MPGLDAKLGGAAVREQTPYWDWSLCPVKAWRQPVYESSYFAPLFQSTVGLVRKHASSWPANSCRLLDIACGTGELVRECSPFLKCCIGIDNNSGFINYAKDFNKSLPNVQFFHHDATKLQELITEDLEITTCVGNSFGIFPAEVRQGVCHQVKRLMKSDGVFIIGFWHASHLGEAVENFYKRAPQLCGTLEGAKVENNTLKTKTGYTTHWWTPEEACELLRSCGFEVEQVIEEDNGLFLICRQPGFLASKQAHEASTANGNQAALDAMNQPQSNGKSYAYVANGSGPEGEVGAYYSSDDAFRFYKSLWGSSHIHIGLYAGEGPSGCAEVPLEEACHATVQRLLNHCDAAVRLGPGSAVADMGAAYGGTARLFARSRDCRVACVEISEKENQENARLSGEEGMQHLISIHPESFCATSLAASSVDVVYSIDSFLHAGPKRAEVFREVARILKPGGAFVYTDIMQADVLPEEGLPLLDRVLARLKLIRLGSVGSDQGLAAEHGLTHEAFHDHSRNVAAHYGTIRGRLLQRRHEFSEAFVERMSDGLEAWVSASEAGMLVWGFMVMRKPAAEGA